MPCIHIEHARTFTATAYNSKQHTFKSDIHCGYVSNLLHLASDVEAFEHVLVDSDARIVVYDGVASCYTSHCLSSFIVLRLGAIGR